jgi:hypothetical protein
MAAARWTTVALLVLIVVTLLLIKGEMRYQGCRTANATMTLAGTDNSPGNSSMGGNVALKDATGLSGSLTPDGSCSHSPF